MNLTIFEHDSVSHDGDVSLAPISRLGGENTRVFGRVPQDKVVETIADSEAIIVNKTLITREVMTACPKLRYVGLFATGYNNIDLAAADERGIYVVNAPGYSTDSVAQLVFAYILEFATSLSRYRDSVADGDWIACKNFTYFPWTMRALAGKTLGIIGYGAIGERVASIASAFGMNVIISTRTERKNCPYKHTDRLSLVRHSDFVTIHTPLTPETAKMVNTEFLSAMKPTACLINTARGGVVDETALANALNNNVIAGAALDVLTAEPMRSDCPLAATKNCIITPHIAWATLDARIRLVEMVAENLSAYMRGEPRNAVNRV